MTLELRDGGLSEFERGLLAFAQNVPGLGDALKSLLSGFFAGISERNEAKRLENLFLRISEYYNVTPTMTVSEARNLLPVVVNRKKGLLTRTDRVGKRYVKALTLIEEVLKKIVDVGNSSDSVTTQSVSRSIPVINRSARSLPSSQVVQSKEISPAIKAIIPLAIGALLF